MATFLFLFLLAQTTETFTHSSRSQFYPCDPMLSDNKLEMEIKERIKQTLQWDRAVCNRNETLIRVLYDIPYGNEWLVSLVVPDKGPGRIILVESKESIRMANQNKDLVEPPVIPSVDLWQCEIKGKTAQRIKELLFQLIQSIDLRVRQVTYLHYTSFLFVIDQDDRSLCYDAISHSPDEHFMSAIFLYLKEYAKSRNPGLLRMIEKTCDKGWEFLDSPNKTAPQ